MPVNRAHPSDHKPTVGFCFSFPVEQTDLASGKLIRWTKRFENEGAVDADPVELLHSALKRQEMPVSVNMPLHACLHCCIPASNDNSFILTRRALYCNLACHSLNRHSHSRCDGQQSPRWM